jgi:hypothetical protein
MKRWPCKIIGPGPFMRSSCLLVDPGDIRPPHPSPRCPLIFPLYKTAPSAGPHHPVTLPRSHTLLLTARSSMCESAPSRRSPWLEVPALPRRRRGRTHVHWRPLRRIPAQSTVRRRETGPTSSSLSPLSWKPRAGGRRWSISVLVPDICKYGAHIYTSLKSLTRVLVFLCASP